MLAVVFLGALAVTAALCRHGGLRTINVVLNRGGSYWLPMNPGDPRLPLGVRLGLQPAPPVATAGSFAWRTVQPGLDVAELPVMAGHTEVDSILLSRYAVFA
jgi:hypothetical protein